MNIVLIGMPGSGKSTIGVLLAKAMLFDYIDTDLIIQNICKKSLHQIIADNGLDEFKAIENNILKTITADNSIIATGGSAVYGKEAMLHLKTNGKVIYLKLSPATIKNRINNIKTRGIAMEPGSSIESLYCERMPLYERYADIIIDCENKTIEGCVDAIIESISK